MSRRAAFRYYLAPVRVRAPQAMGVAGVNTRRVLCATPPDLERPVAVHTVAVCLPAVRGVPVVTVPWWAALERMFTLT